MSNDFMSNDFMSVFGTKQTSGCSQSMSALADAAAKPLTSDSARWIVANIAKLPTLLKT
jgi:hypothetical protein